MATAVSTVALTLLLHISHKPNDSDAECWENCATWAPPSGIIW